MRRFLLRTIRPVIELRIRHPYYLDIEGMSCRVNAPSIYCPNICRGEVDFIRRPFSADWRLVYVYCSWSLATVDMQSYLEYDEF